jgi:2-methylcitrate dehydratase
VDRALALERHDGILARNVDRILAAEIGEGRLDCRHAIWHGEQGFDIVIGEKDQGRAPVEGARTIASSARGGKLAGTKHAKGTSVIAQLARRLAAFDGASVSAAALGQAKLLVLDTIGCAFAGSREEVARATRDVALRGGAGECVLIGSARKTGVTNAVLANGVAARVLDLNDYLVNEANGQPEAGGHPSDNIPVALAMGAARGRSGRDVLAAIVAGYEIYARLQRSMDRAGPWDGVTVSGLVAPAMAGLLMGLDAGRLAHALALGLARAPTPAIVRSGHISAAKSLSNALVAQGGVQAALLAEAGITGPLAIFEDARGLGPLFGNAPLAALVEPLPDAGAIMRCHVKAYPCINTGQSAVAAALQLHAALNGDIAGLTRIALVMADYPVIKRQQEDPGRIHPASREAADHSFPFIVAAALHDGKFGIAQYDNERWRDPAITALMDKIEMRRDAAWNTRSPGSYPCTIRATDGSGREHEIEVPYPPGFSLHAGLDAASVTEKFHATTAPVLGFDARTRIVDAIMQFEHSPTTAPLDAAIATEGDLR